MSSNIDSARVDLAFLRGLVDDDNPGPGLWAFGAAYLSLGLVLCAHVLASFLLEGRPLFAAYVVLYGGASLFWTWVSRRARNVGYQGMGGVGVKGRVGATVLLAAFAAHLVMLAVFLIVALRQQNGIFMELAPLVLFVTQSVVWFVVHVMRRRAWQLLEALGWLAAPLALAPFVGTEAFGVGIAIAAVVLMIVPGAYMMRLAGKLA
jgi:hypothetical protein